MKLYIKEVFVILIFFSSGVYGMEESGKKRPFPGEAPFKIPTTKRIKFPHEKLADIFPAIEKIKEKLTEPNQDLSILITQFLDIYKDIEITIFTLEKNDYAKQQEIVLNDFQYVINHLITNQEYELASQLLKRITSIKWKKSGSSKKLTAFSATFKKLAKNFQNEPNKDNQKVDSEAQRTDPRVIEQEILLIETQLHEKKSEVQQIFLKIIQNSEILFQTLVHKQITPNDFVELLLKHYQELELINLQTLMPLISLENQTSMIQNIIESIDFLINNANFDQAFAIIDNGLRLSCWYFSDYNKKIFFASLKQKNRELKKVIIEKIKQKRNKILKKAQQGSSEKIFKVASSIPELLKNIHPNIYSRIQSTILKDFHTMALHADQNNNFDRAFEIIDCALSIPWKLVTQSQLDEPLKSLREIIMKKKQNMEFEELYPLLETPLLLFDTPDLDAFLDHDNFWHNFDMNN